MNKMLITLTLLALLLVACVALETESPTPISITPTSTQSQLVDMYSIGDGGLVSNQPCMSPCFFGIRVGETFSDQVIPTLENNGISPCYQIDETDILCGDTNIANVSVTINRATLIVDGVGYNPSVSISVQNVIKSYGEPTLLQIEVDYTNGLPEAPSLLAVLFWDQKKMGIALPEIRNIGEQVYFIEKTTEVEWVSFYDEITYSKIRSREISEPWKGYGTYEP